MLKVIRKMDVDGWFIYGTVPASADKPAEWEAEWEHIATCNTQEDAQRIAAQYARSEEAWAKLVQ